MNLDFLLDEEFLAKVDKINLRTHYAKVALLDFDEKPLDEITGAMTAGTLNVNGSSAVRRTINFTMLASPEVSNIQNLDNKISLNKKIYVWVGLKNVIPEAKYQSEDILWFPCGLFIISSASVNRGTNGWNISIQGRDKMALLDGTAGGVLPASVIFHERQVELATGNILIEEPTVYQIIFEAVNHWGGEKVENIVISDLDDRAKLLVKYMGEDPLYFNEHYTAFSKVKDDIFFHPVSYGEDAGYLDTELTYPGELILNAGDTVVTLLDKIVKMLGNYEYFYDINGKFVFQEIKNYLNNSGSLLDVKEEDYLRTFGNARYKASFTDLEGTASINIQPKYDSIKNDFYAWGSRKTTEGAENLICYHLAIDAKPSIDLAAKYMWQVNDGEALIRYDFTESIGQQMSYNQWLQTNNKEISTTETETEYKNFLEACQSVNNTDYVNPSDKVNAYIALGENYAQALSNRDINHYTYTLIGLPCTEWREELYRRALLAQSSTGVYDNYYDMELLKSWRDLYDTLNPNWAGRNYWNPDVYDNPQKLNFWIDFIDTSSYIGDYSINNIGRRTKVVSDKNISAVINKEVPDVIFMDGYDSDKVSHYDEIGQEYFILTSEYYNLFTTSSTWTSCFDKIREMLYQNLSYNTTIQISCLPRYYLDANQVIYISDKDSNINGNYLITQFSIPLAYNGMMNITATEVLTRV